MDELTVVHPGRQERSPVGSVGRLIKMARKAKGLSLRQAGEDSGIDWNTIGRLERCEIVPNLRNFLKLADWLELSNEGAMAVARTLVREVTEHTENVYSGHPRAKSLLQQEVEAFPRLARGESLD